MKRQSKSILPRFMMTWPGAILTGLVIAIVLKSSLSLPADVIQSALPRDWAPDCFTTQSKIDLSHKSNIQTEALQRDYITRRLDKSLPVLLDLAAKCNANLCSGSELKRLKKTVKAYVKTRAMRYRAASEFGGLIYGRPADYYYDTRNDELLRIAVKRLYENDVVELKTFRPYQKAVRMWVYKPRAEFRACSA